MEMWEGALVSEHVAFETSTFPLLQGTMEHPSGPFPSDLYSPDCSSWDGMLADESDLCMTSFTAVWRGCLPLLYRQLRPWVARWSTSALQWMHWFGLHREVPSLRPTATRVVPSSSRSPKLGTGRACSQAPDLLLQTARSLAHYLASCARGAGGGLSCPCIHELKASALAA